jgi:hypothetical protein
VPFSFFGNLLDFLRREVKKAGFFHRKREFLRAPTKFDLFCGWSKRNVEVKAFDFRFNQLTSLSITDFPDFQTSVKSAQIN